MPNGPSSRAGVVKIAATGMPGTLTRKLGEIGVRVS